MPASEAQIRSARENGRKSKGPKTAEGKEKSRANAYKHGLTATVVLPEREAAEVQRRYLSFAAELKPAGEVGLALTLHAARMSVRMERAADHENAMMTERVRKALADYEYPEGLDEAALVKLRAEISNRATFDDSKEATLARKYEAAAERGFLRALKELRLLEARRKEDEAEMMALESGSFSPEMMSDEEFDRFEAEFDPSPSWRAPRAVGSDVLAELRGRVDVPIAVGKRR